MGTDSGGWLGCGLIVGEVGVRMGTVIVAGAAHLRA